MSKSRVEQEGKIAATDRRVALLTTIPGVARRIWPALRGVEAVDKYTVRFHNATPDVTLEGRLYAFGSQIASKRAWDEAASYAEWANRPVTTGPYRVEEFRPDVSLTLVAFDDYWGGRPPLRQLRFVEVPEVSSRDAVAGFIQWSWDKPGADSQAWDAALGELEARGLTS